MKYNNLTKNCWHLFLPVGKTDISGVAVGIDLGGKSKIGPGHPPNKNEMSRRMALQVRTEPRMNTLPVAEKRREISLAS